MQNEEVLYVLILHGLQKYIWKGTEEIGYASCFQGREKSGWSTQLRKDFNKYSLYLFFLRQHLTLCPRLECRLNHSSL